MSEQEPEFTDQRNDAGIRGQILRILMCASSGRKESNVLESIQASPHHPWTLRDVGHLREVIRMMTRKGLVSIDTTDLTDVTCEITEDGMAYFAGDVPPDIDIDNGLV